MKHDNYINFDDISEEELPFPKGFDNKDDQDDLFLVEDLDDEVQDEINYLKEEPPEDYESSNDDFEFSLTKVKKKCRSLNNYSMFFKIPCLQAWENIKDAPQTN